jgi:gas vesicle protein
MPQWMQGVIIGLLISGLLGIIVGFYLRQSQVNHLNAALKTSQNREKTLQQEHENRLRDATAKLQQDYEAQLADKIERYQQQYEMQRQQLEAEYEARQNLMPGGPGGTPETPEAMAKPWETAPTSEYEVRLRQQYEARLKEAAQKIQNAYEQHLRETLATEREVQQQEYDQRLAEAIARYQDEMSQRTAQLEQEFAARLQMAQATQPPAEPPTDPPVVAELPSQSELEARFQAEYDQRLTEAVARHQDEMADHLQALEQDYEARLHMATGGGDADLEARLRQDIEAELRAEYDLQMAEKLEQFQANLNQRTQDFESGLITTMDPFADAAIDAESLEAEIFLGMEETASPLETPSETPLEMTFNLDDLDDFDLSALSDDDLALSDGGDGDIFNLETLAQQAGVDLGELNNLLNQPDSTTTEEPSIDFSDED